MDGAAIDQIKIKLNPDGSLTDEAIQAIVIGIRIAARKHLKTLRMLPGEERDVVFGARIKVPE